MTTSTSLPQVLKAEVSTRRLVLHLSDGTKAEAPLDLFPVLAAARPEEWAAWEVIHGGHAVRWPLLDEDISVFSVLHPDETIPMRPEAVTRRLRNIQRRRARDGRR
ncbi:MAG TPA: DUF2442 domain-containing protein [Longimicrobiales bacterium]|nr:DUF2442 domain-containing protein [Longimicrobiales bacterium]